MMPRWQRAYLIATCAIIGGAFAYAACDWAQWPRLTYLPIREAFTMKAPPTVVSMAYIGIVAWGLGGAAVGAVVGFVLCATIRKPLPERALQLFGAWAITGILLAGCYYTWNLWPW